MAYVSGFEHDIFLSYSHVDNLRAASRRRGWIEEFHQDLEVRLAQRSGRIGRVTVWRDERRLKGNELFDATIQEALAQSATFLAVTSYGYLTSDYCRKELTAFYEKAATDAYGLAIGNKLRIFNVLLYDIPPEQWPKESQHTIGNRFYSASGPNEPSKPNEPGKRYFTDRIWKLTEDIYSLLEAFGGRASTPTVAAGDIFLTESSPSRSNTAGAHPAPAAITTIAQPRRALDSTDRRPEQDTRILLEFHSKDYDEAARLDEFLRGRGFQTVTSPDADRPRRNLELFEERLRHCRAMVILVHQVSEAWVRERVNAALQAIATRDCPTRAILVHVVPPRNAPAPEGPQFNAVSVRWLDQMAADANRVDGLTLLVRELEGVLT